MNAEVTLTQERAELLRDSLAGMLQKLFEAGAPDPNDVRSPMQRLMEGPARDEFMTLMKLITFAFVQKLLPYMQGGDPMDPSLLGLAGAKVTVDGETATYHLKPGRLITHWTNEKGQYKVKDVGFKVSWWWALWNWRFVRDMRRKMKERQAALSAPSSGTS
ncbi:MAG: hypothetical protein WBB04_11405 [Candidatus Macondimonas sp.]|jgi:hypothetical protein